MKTSKTQLKMINDLARNDNDTRWSMYNQAKQTKQTHNLLQMSTRNFPPKISPFP